MEIPFNKPLLTGQELNCFEKLISSGNKYSGDGLYTKKSPILLREILQWDRVLLKTSCTHALEMDALLIDIKAGDEVIMPSFTFVCTANPFVLRGAKIDFVDIRPDTMNIHERLIEQAITKNTKAIVPVIMLLLAAIWVR